ncbi:MAG: Na+/H+ antiporter [Candidatus Obscuribacterales bacterium]|nr:Na+/H+ antiporter [Candidatus Obscuribacterales bacterium]
MNTSGIDLHIFFVLVLVATCVAIAIKWIRLPYSIALVLVGLNIGIFHLLPPVVMTPELILLFFLPAMLFEASWNLDLRMMKRCFQPVIAFATVGVGLSTAVVGAVLHYMAGVDMTTAMLFGAMISATDPISVLALFKRMGIEKRLITILEGESLLNDATAVVLFRILLAAAITGGAISAADLGMQFLLVTFGGAAIGIVLGLAASFLTKFFDDHLLEITLTIIVAYGSYLISEQFHASSVMAVLVAGIVMGNYGSKTYMSASTRLAVDSFWEYGAFIAESLVFLLIGMQIKVDLLIKYAPLIGVAILAILVGRLVVIYGLAPFVSSKVEPIPFKWRHLLFWGGVRGALCMAMALSLPQNFPLKEGLIVTTFGVALFTLLIQGLTFEPLIRVLKVRGMQSVESKYLAIREDIQRYHEEMEKLNILLSQGKLEQNQFDEQVAITQHKIEVADSLVIKLQEDGVDIDEIERIQIERALIVAQRDCLNTLSRRGRLRATLIKRYRTKLHVEAERLLMGDSELGSEGGTESGADLPDRASIGSDS